jgi:hypothetical protein
MLRFAILLLDRSVHGEAATSPISSSMRATPSSFVPALGVVVGFIMPATNISATNIGCFTASKYGQGSSIASVSA